MKNKYKILLLLLALPLLDVMYACCNCNVLLEEKFFVNSGFSIKNIDNSGVEPILSDAQSINKNAFGLRFNVNRQIISSIKNETYQTLFSQGAYAFSCDCGPDVTYDPVDKVESIKIITLNNFNSEKPANSDVTEYFRTQKNYLEVDEIVRKLNSFYFDSLQETEYFDLLLMVSPSDGNIEHQFKLIITFENKPTVELLTTVNLI